MFTIEQIKEKHSHVKSGSDFPKYVQDLISLGVARYDAFVSDGHSEYDGKDGHHVISDAKYSPIDVAEESDSESFKQYLKIHQEGQTSYLEFCRHAADTGIMKWTVSMPDMTCTYYNRAGEKVLVEVIPAPGKSA